MSNGANLSYPVLPLEYPAVAGEAIRPCPDCLPWSVDVVPDHPQGGAWVREWHAVGCPVFDEKE